MSDNQVPKCCGDTSTLGVGGHLPSDVKGRFRGLKSNLGVGGRLASDTKCGSQRLLAEKLSVEKESKLEVAHEMGSIGERVVGPLPSEWVSGELKPTVERQKVSRRGTCCQASN